MYKFISMTNKESINHYIDFWKVNIIQTLKTNNRMVWNISDKYGNSWNFIFNNHVKEFQIESVPKFACDEYFMLNVYFNSKENKVEIHNVIKKQKIYKSERFLKKYTDLCCVVYNLFYFGYFK